MIKTEIKCYSNLSGKINQKKYQRELLVQYYKNGGIKIPDM